MGVRKFRSVEDMPPPPALPPLDPENLRLAWGLASLGRLRMLLLLPGVRKFRSWDDLLEWHDSAARRGRSGPPPSNGRPEGSAASG